MNLQAATHTDSSERGKSGNGVGSNAGNIVGGSTDDGLQELSKMLKELQAATQAALQAATLSGWQLCT